MEMGEYVKETTIRPKSKQQPKYINIVNINESIQFVGSVKMSKHIKVKVQFVKYLFRCQLPQLKSTKQIIM